MNETFTRRNLLGMGLAVGVFATTVGCADSKPVPVPSDDHIKDVAVVIHVGDNFYEPASVSISSGQAVRWEWVGRERHDVVSSDRTFVSELKTEGSYTHQFNEAGEFPYLCSIHPEMRGVVAVS